MAEDKKVQTPEEQEAAQAELMGRVEEFNKELLPLLGKYNLGLGASAFVNQNGTIGARPIMFDASAAKPGEENKPTAGEATAA